MHDLERRQAEMRTKRQKIGMAIKTRHTAVQSVLPVQPSPDVRRPPDNPFASLPDIPEIARAERGETLNVRERRRALMAIVDADVHVHNTILARLFGVSERMIRVDLSKMREALASHHIPLPPPPPDMPPDSRASQILVRIHEAAQSRRRSSLEVATLLSEVKTRRYWRIWGYFSFSEWVRSDPLLGLSVKEAFSFCKVVEDAAILGIPEQVLVRAKFSNLREIFRLNEEATLANKDVLADLVRRCSRLTRIEVVAEMAPLLGKTATVYSQFSVSLTDAQLHAVQEALSKVQAVRGGTRGSALAEVCDTYSRLVRPKPTTAAA